MKKGFLSIILFSIIALMLLTTVSFADSSYTEWTETTSLPTTSGAYKLTEDVTITSKVTIKSATVTLDLNGHKVTFNGSSAYIHVQPTGSLIIEDSESTGLITNTGVGPSGQKLIDIQGNCQINGGTLENTLASVAVLYINNGSGSGAAATCTLNSGTILNSYDRGGRAVNMGSNATFTMNGGTIKSLAGNGQGDLPAVQGGNIKITGGTIKVEAAPRTNPNTGEPVVAKGMAIQSNGKTVEITGGTIIADGYALQTTNVVVNPAEGKTVNISAGMAILRPYNTTSEGTGNQLLGGNFDAPELSRGTYSKNVEVYGGTYTNNNAPMDLTDFLDLDGATVDSNGKVTCSHTETYEDGAVEATCTTEGKTADTICSNCKKLITAGTTIPMEQHQHGEWKIEKEATCTEKGSRYKECVCGDKVAEEIEATGHRYEDGKCTVCGNVENKKDETPKTGSVDVVLFVSAIIAAACIAGIISVKKYTR